MPRGKALARSVPLASGQFLRRTRLVAKVPVKAVQRPRDTGPKTTARRKVRIRSGGLCELALPGCKGRASQACHRLGKKAGGRHGEMGELINGPAWFLDGCWHCHRLTTSAVEPLLSEYRHAGLLLKEGQDARKVPVQVRWSPVPVRLDDAGGWAVD